MLNIENIDVKKTFEKILNTPEEIYIVLIATEKELKGEPVEIPPEDDFELLIYAAKQNTLFFTVNPDTYTFDKLYAFAKLPQATQKKILFRAYHLYRKYFTIGNAVKKLSLHFLNESL